MTVYEFQGDKIVPADASSEWSIERNDAPTPRDPTATETVSDLTHRRFFGDAEHTFKIAAPLVLELERKLGAGIGSICQRIFSGDFSQADVSETIRIALIGGGCEPSEAAALVAAYVPARPLIESYELAVAVLEQLWFGRSLEAGRVGMSAVENALAGDA